MRFLGGLRDFVDELRDPKPRMKPGITFFRLFVFLIVAGTLGVVAINVATIGSPSRDECVAKGIDPQELKTGTCEAGETTLVVVDRHDTLKLETLEARITTIHYRKIAAKSASASGETLITFDVWVKNLTDDPASVGKGIFVLYAGNPRTEDATFEKTHEPRSFLARDQNLSPQSTTEGTVTFRVPSTAARGVRRDGNLDVVNLDEPVSPADPEALFFKDEYGVFRTYH